MNMNKADSKTIWIINQYASHLETRHWELAKTFSNQGYTVAVIASSFHHGKREYIYDEPIKIVERMPDVSYIYLHSGPPYLGNGGKRVFNMLDFCRMFRRYEKEIAARIGVPAFVIASSAPPFVWEVGYSSAKRFNAKFIAEFRDIWPLSLVEIQGISPRHPLVQVLSVIEKRTYKRADAIVSTMPEAWRHAVKVSGVPREKVFWMPNGIDTREVDQWLSASESLPPELDEFLSSHWCCLYVGSIVKSECLDFLVDAIGKLEDEDIYFAVVGEGHEKENIQSLINMKGYTNIKVFPFLDRQLIPKALHKAGCCVAACKDVGIGRYGLSMYKLSDYLYSGKPTLFAYDLQSVVNEAGHYAIPYGDEKMLAETVRIIRASDEIKLKELSEKAQKVIREEYDFTKIGEKYLSAITSC